MKNLFYTISPITAPLFHLPVFGQTSEQQHLFTTIANSFGQAKPIPKLEITKTCKSSAKYLPSEQKIQIEECLIQLTKSFGKDSTNALAIIMGHELAHYYKSHEWSREFAYSLRGTKISEAISSEKSDFIEAQADQIGLLQVALCGYQPYEVYKKLIGAIYSKYKLGDKIPGYPTKTERIKIAESVAYNSLEMYPVYMAGVFLSSIDENEFATECFEKVLKVYPSREVLNNIAVCKMREIVKNTSKLHLPFIFDLEIDPITRLKKPTLRGADSETDEEVLLNNAMRFLENAILTDKTYSEAYYNLALCYILKGDYEIAIGKLHEAGAIPSSVLSTKFIMLKSIAYYMDGQQDKALNTMKLLKESSKKNDYNKEIICKGLAFFNSKVELNNWLKMNIPKNTINEPQKSNFKATELNSNYETISLKDNHKIEYKLNDGLVIVNIADGKRNYLINIKVIDKKAIGSLKTNFLKIEDYSDYKITIIEY
jgi:tetratricopeptide (TPR) repeat protein